jgi:hypothetical protein
VEDDLRNKMQDWDAEMPFEMPTLAVVKPLVAVAEPKIVSMRQNYRWSIAASVVLAMGALIWLWQSKQHSESQMTHTEPPKMSPEPSPATPQVSPVPPQTPPATAQVTPVPPQSLPELPKKPVVQPSKPVQTAPPIVQVTPEPVIPPAPQTPVPNMEDYAAVAEANYKKDPFEVREDTRSSEPTETLTPAQKAYKEGHFKEVISLLKNISIEKAQVANLNLLAHAYFQQKQFANALPLFEKMVEWNRLMARQEAEWYLLLDYLAQRPQYQTQFDALAQQIKGNPKHEFHAKVVALLETIQKK